MNHHIARALTATLLALAALALCSGCARRMAAGHQSTPPNYAAALEAVIADDTKKIEAKPDDHMAYMNRAGAYMGTRRYDLALEDYRKAIALAPEETVSHSGYVNLLVFMRREQEAAEYAERLLRSHPDSALLHCSLARALELRKDYPRAHEAASRCIALAESGGNPRERMFVPMKGFAGAYGQQARLLARVGREDEAWRSIEKATSLENDFETRYYRASIHYIEGSWEKALQVLREADAQAKRFERGSIVWVESRFLLGQCYQQLGRWREAREAYEEFIAANPHEKEAFANLGLCKAKLGESDGAVADLSKALDLDPKFLDARRNRGTEHLRQKRYDSAIEDFSAALAEDGNDAGTLYKRAYAYCTSGQRKLGAKDLREVLRIEPKNDEAKALLSECT